MILSDVALVVINPIDGIINPTVLQIEPGMQFFGKVVFGFCKNIEVSFQCLAAIPFVINFAVSCKLRPDNRSEMITGVRIP